MKKDLMDGKEVELEKLPRVLIGKVLEVKMNPNQNLKRRMTNGYKYSSS